jgi:hypothetical protein
MDIAFVILPSFDSEKRKPSLEERELNVLAGVTRHGDGDLVHTQEFLGANPPVCGPVRSEGVTFEGTS